MKKDRKIEKLDFDDQFMLDVVESRFQSGDYLAALSVLNKRNSMHAPSADAHAFAADIYESMGLWDLAADAWYRFMDVCNQADFPEAYEGLSTCYMNRGDDLRAMMFFHHAYGQDAAQEFFDADDKPDLRFVEDDDTELFRAGNIQLKKGNFKGAAEIYSKMTDAHPDYPSAMGMTALCLLMEEDVGGARKKCEESLEKFPDNVQLLMSYCAVLGIQEEREKAKEVAKHLAGLECGSTDELYQVAMALCEAEMHAEVYEKLRLIEKEEPYDDSVLFCRAVAAFRLGKTDEAISAMELFTTVYPYKYYGAYVLTRMREFRDENRAFSPNYVYRLPDDAREEVESYLAHVKAGLEEGEYARLSEKEEEIVEMMRLAFDGANGWSDDLLMEVFDLADELRLDDFLREVLLNFRVPDSIKLYIVHILTVRNEEDSFGVVFFQNYKEYFTAKLDIEEAAAKPFLNGFADVYTRFAFALFDDGNENKIVAAAEDIYHTLYEEGEDMLLASRNEIAAAICREARLPHKSLRSLDDIIEMFDANAAVTKKILNYMM